MNYYIITGIIFVQCKQCGKIFGIRDGRTYLVVWGWLCYIIECLVNRSQMHKWLLLIYLMLRLFYYIVLNTLTP